MKIKETNSSSSGAYQTGGTTKIYNDPSIENLFELIDEALAESVDLDITIDKKTMDMYNKVTNDVSNYFKAESQPYNPAHRNPHMNNTNPSRWAGGMEDLRYDFPLTDKQKADNEEAILQTKYLAQYNETPSDGTKELISSAKERKRARENDDLPFMMLGNNFNFLHSNMKQQYNSAFEGKTPILKLKSCETISEGLKRIPDFLVKNKNSMVEVVLKNGDKYLCKKNSNGKFQYKKI